MSRVTKNIYPFAVKKIHAGVDQNTGKPNPSISYPEVKRAQSILNAYIDAFSKTSEPLGKLQKLDVDGFWGQKTTDALNVWAQWDAESRDKQAQSFNSLSDLNYLNQSWTEDQTLIQNIGKETSPEEWGVDPKTLQEFIASSPAMKELAFKIDFLWKNISYGASQNNLQSKQWQTIGLDFILESQATNLVQRDKPQAPYSEGSKVILRIMTAAPYDKTTTQVDVSGVLGPAFKDTMEKLNKELESSKVQFPASYHLARFPGTGKQ